MEEQLRKQIQQLIRNEVVLATGCTEPGAVALCVTKARETLGREPEHIKLECEQGEKHVWHVSKLFRSDVHHRY